MPERSTKTDRRKRILEEAWIGDAVLSLYVRRKILREDGAVDGAKAVRLTSNEFLLAFGEPSEVEAELGRVFESEGLEAAYSWIEQKLIPLFERQEANRRRRAGDGRPTPKRGGIPPKLP